MGTLKEGLKRFFNFRGLAWRMGFLFLTGIMIIFLITFFYVTVKSYRMMLNEAQLTAGDKANLTANRIGNVIRPIEEVASVLAQSIRFSPENFALIHSISRDYVVENPTVYGSIIAFEPDFYKHGKKYHAEYCYQTRDTLKDLTIEREDYDYFTYDWYCSPKKQAKPGWSEPYFDKGAGNILMCTYYVPFYLNTGPDRQFAGVLTMDISLASLERIVSSVRIFKSGYAMMISRKGVVLTSPNRQYVNRNLVEVVRERWKGITPERGRESSTVLIEQILSKARKGESGFLKLPRLVNTSKPGWICYTPVASTGWSLLIIFPEEELVSDLNSFLKKLVLVIFLSIVATLIVTILVVRRVTKPITRLAFAARAIGQGKFNVILPVYRSKDEISLLANSFSLMQEELRSYLENLKKSTAAREKIESDIAVARDLQQGLLPREFPSIANCDLHARLDPARVIGGDLYDFFFLDEDHLCFAIGDVSGKGVPGSLFMAIARTLFRSYMTIENPPDKVMAIVNRELCRENPSLMFVTFQVGILNLKTGVLLFCNAGHNRPYILAERGGVVRYSCNPGLPLGIRSDFVYSTESIVLKKGDLLFLYTDGITEAINEAEETYGEERLAKVLETSHARPVNEISTILVNDIKAFAGSTEQYDDITLLVLRYNGSAVPGLIGTDRLSIRNSVNELHKVVAFVELLSAEYVFSQKMAIEINLVLEELISNIIFYGYDDDAAHEITIEFERSENKMAVTVTDDGKPFNLLEKNIPFDPSAPLEARKPGGLGIHFIRTLTDSVGYTRKDDRNIIRFTKMINK
ncbi:MAG: SpoIIE family protein phosphatase [Bacteroidetes bacterium]|nr:SpoIIE family protein phosphatase [Bacteroidota bacterium]